MKSIIIVIVMNCFLSRVNTVYTSIYSQYNEITLLTFNLNGISKKKHTQKKRKKEWNQCVEISFTKWLFLFASSHIHCIQLNYVNARLVFNFHSIDDYIWSIDRHTHRILQI